MKTWLINWWDEIRTSFWTVPALLTLAAFFLAWLLPELDQFLEDNSFESIVSTPEAARLSLSSIAGAMITVTGVVFSITVVALTNTANQFGSRLLRQYMENTVTHFTLGFLVATSLYCLLVLRLVVDTNERVFVPHLSVALGIFLAVASLGMFVILLHNISRRFQAPNLVRSVANDLQDTVDRLYSPRKAACEEEADFDYENWLKEKGNPAKKIKCQTTGYLQAINFDQLVHMACQGDFVGYLIPSPGSFLSPTQEVLHIWNKSEWDAFEVASLQACFITGNTRTPRQDLECAVNEVVEIGVRALSPGINDPFTAMTCIDYLGSSLIDLANRNAPSPEKRDEKGVVRIVTKPISFNLILPKAFRLIVHYGKTNETILEHLIKVLEKVSAHTTRKADKIAMREELLRLKNYCENFLDDDIAGKRLADYCQNLLQSTN